jgi:hypothetical protein
MFAALELTLAGIAAIIAAVGGLISAIVALRKAKQEGEENCQDQLKKSRAEAEHYARELHDIKLKYPDAIPPMDEGKARLWFTISLALIILATALAMMASGISFGPKGPAGPPGPIQTVPFCPKGFVLTTIELKENDQIFLAAICIAQ